MLTPPTRPYLFAPKINCEAIVDRCTAPETCALVHRKRFEGGELQSR